MSNSTGLQQLLDSLFGPGKVDEDVVLSILLAIAAVSLPLLWGALWDTQPQKKQKKSQAFLDPESFKDAPLV